LRGKEIAGKAAEGQLIPPWPSLEELQAATPPAEEGGEIPAEGTTSTDSNAASSGPADSTAEGTASSGGAQ